MAEGAAATAVLRAVLRYQGRTQRWLAMNTGDEPSAVRQWVSGARPAPATFRAACARLLGVPEWLLFSPAATARVEGLPVG